MPIFVSIHSVILVVIIPTLEVADTDTTGDGDTVCVGSGAVDDRSTASSALVTN